MSSAGNKELTAWKDRHTTMRALSVNKHIEPQRGRDAQPIAV